jgi:hypothetical protein
MMTFADFAKTEKPNPTTRPRTEATLSQPVKRQLSQANVFPARVAEQIGKTGQPDPDERLTSLSQQIVCLNNAIVGDPSCALVVKRLSEMIVRLHFLVLVGSRGGVSNG